MYYYCSFSFTHWEFEKRPRLCLKPRYRLHCENADAEWTFVDTSEPLCTFSGPDLLLFVTHFAMFFAHFLTNNFISNCPTFYDSSYGGNLISAKSNGPGKVWSNTGEIHSMSCSTLELRYLSPLEKYQLDKNSPLTFSEGWFCLLHSLF